MTAKKKPAEPGPSCLHCRHYAPYIFDGMDQGWGECRRFPPTVHMVDGEEGQEPLTMFPQVEPIDLCGELSLKH